MHIFQWVILSLALASAVACSPSATFEIDGLAVGSQPVRQAEVIVFRLDMETGEVSSGHQPYRTARTDDFGRFHLENVHSDDLPLLFQIVGGVTFEYWSGQSISLGPDGLGGGDGEYPLQAVVNAFYLDGPFSASLPVVVSPYTTVVKALADQRYESGWRFGDDYYSSVVHFARDRVWNHLGAAPNRDMPAPIGEFSTPNERHALALRGLSDLARTIAERAVDLEGQSVQRVNTLMLMQALVRDAEGDALLDGMGPDGQRIELGNCSPACTLSADTLRVVMVKALLTGLLRSDGDPNGGVFFGPGAIAPEPITDEMDEMDDGEMDDGEMDDGEMDDRLEWDRAASYLEHLAQNDDPTLFGGPPADELLDSTPPIVATLPSLVHDEAYDRITFLSSEGHPVHQHDEKARVDLSLGWVSPSVPGDLRCSKQLDGTLPSLHKHVHRLCSEDENPLQWRIRVRDDLVGVPVQGVHAYVGLEPDIATMVPVQVERGPPSPPSGDGSSEFRITALCQDVPELLQKEGTFYIALDVEDWSGNRSERFWGCWDHTPRAAPLLAGSLRPATVFGEVGLEFDNMVPLLRGQVSLWDELPLLELSLTNPTDYPVYLEPEIEQIAGAYLAHWIRGQSYLETDEEVDMCLAIPPTCESMPPAYDEPQLLADRSGSIASLSPHWRVFDVSTGQFLQCSACPVGVVRIPADGVYLLQLVVDDLSPLVPSGDIDPEFINEIALGPVGEEPTYLTGVRDEFYVHCYFANMPICDRHDFYRYYRALQSTTLQIAWLTVQGHSAPSVSLDRHIPQPPGHPRLGTMSHPLILTSEFVWESSDVLPPINPTFKSPSNL